MSEIGFMRAEWENFAVSKGLLAQPVPHECFEFCSGGIADFRWHDLRHTFATWHRQAGTPTHELQRLGGWKTGVMVERYAHVAPEALQSAASRLDALGGYVLATLKEKGAARKS